MNVNYRIKNRKGEGRMFAKRIIPCLDVTGGRVVKGVNFVNLVDAGDPVAAAREYNRQGADELVFLDITATSDGRETMADVVRRTASEVFIPLTVGGGIRTVEDIRLCATKLVTLDNRVVIVPNGTASGSTVVNYSVKDLRRVDQTFSVSYHCDFEKAKAILAGIMNAHEKVLKDPAPFVRVSAQGQSSIELTTRAWVKAEDYWTVYFDMLEQVKARFDESDICIPYQQLDVHVKQD